MQGCNGADKIKISYKLKRHVVLIPTSKPTFGSETFYYASPTSSTEASVSPLPPPVIWSRSS